MDEAEQAVMSLAERQYGVIARRQAVDLKMSDRAIDRRITAKRWDPIAAGVFRIVGAVRDEHQILMAGIQLNIPRLFAALVLITLSGVALFGLTVLATRLALGHWHESEV